MIQKTLDPKSTVGRLANGVLKLRTAEVIGAKYTSQVDFFIREDKTF